MSIAWLRSSLALWRRREEFRKQRHTIWNRKVRKARDRGASEKELAPLLAGRAKWSKLLTYARGRIELREQQLAEATRRPPIVTAAQMGLSFQWVFGSKGTITRGAGHYSAGGRASNRTELVAHVKSFHAYHRSLGWGGCSYEALIADDGTIAFANPPGRKAAAVANQNTGLIGICCPGTTGDRMTERQKRSVAWLLDNWHTTKVPKAHRLPKRASSVPWAGHREFPGQSTACPGDMLQDYKEVWRR